MKIDYIIVGLGLAGLAFAEELRKNNKSFVVFENGSQNSSLIAGGMYNPIILRRFTPVWNVEEQLKSALPLYAGLEEKFGHQYNEKLDIHRIFKNTTEHNQWLLASNKKVVKNYMISSIFNNEDPYIFAPYGYGKLSGTGKILTKNLIGDYRNYLQKKNRIRFETFCYDAMKITDSGIEYQDIKSGKIVFCEGFGIQKNPYFRHIPIVGSKGEILTIDAPNLEVNALIKAAVFLMPLGNSLYRVGASFNREDKTPQPTEVAKQELLQKLTSFVKTGFKIVDHEAGIRPTVSDRRPIIGRHKAYHRLAVFNGLGTRGVIIAPLMARKLYNVMENVVQPDKDISIERFEQ